MSDPAVRVEVRPDRVAVLTIDQPGAKVNVLTVALWTELEAAIDALAARTDLAGLVIASGKPGCFIAGADLHLLATATPGDPAVKAFIEQGLRVLAKLEALPFPTCAAIDGVAFGGGLEVALACDDIAVAEQPRTTLGLPEVNLGLIPGWSGTQLLPRKVGWEAGLRLLLSGASVRADEARRIQLADATFSPDDLLDQTSRWLLRPMEARARYREFPTPLQLSQFDQAPTTAAREVLRVAVQGLPLKLADGIKLETEAFLRLAGSNESRAKIAAFFASRKR